MPQHSHVSTSSYSLTEQLWWLLDPTGKEPVYPSAVAWDRIRFLTLRKRIVAGTVVCPARDGKPVFSEKMKLDQLYARVRQQIGSPPTGSEEEDIEVEFELLGEELLLRPVGYPNKQRCPLEFLTAHESVAWDLPGVKVPRIGCKNYWVRGRAGGSSEWSEEEDNNDGTTR